MPEHIPFPEIQQFRNTIRTVRERAEHDGVPLPTLTFVGSVKLHGTNSSVVFPPEGGFYIQSRTQVITPEKDNNGFAKWATDNEELFLSLRRRLYKEFPLHTGFVVYGEWCGQGIQKGVAISQVSKRFVVFSISILKEGTRDWVHPLSVHSLVEPLFYCIYDYPTWPLDIDFSAPEQVQNRLVELTQAVENECPVGKAFGVSGVGEGIVWWPLPTSDFNVRDLAFKVKGEKHSETKVKTLAAVDVEKLASINELVDSVLTEHRLEKKVESLIEQGGELDIKSTGAFLKLVGSDVHKEEADTIAASGFENNEIMKAVQKKAKQWWPERLSR
jgi:hypothetical protein